MGERRRAGQALDGYRRAVGGEPQIEVAGDAHVTDQYVAATYVAAGLIGQDVVDYELALWEWRRECQWAVEPSTGVGLWSAAPCRAPSHAYPLNDDHAQTMAH